MMVGNIKKRKIQGRDVVQKFKRVGGRSTKFSLDMTSSNENDEEIEDEASEVSVGTSDGRELAEGDEATDESYRESAEQKRLRLAKDYLSKFELSSNAENEETVSNDRGNYQCDSSSISDELRVQRLQRHGEHFQDLSDHFKAVAENIELDDVNSTTKLGGHCQPVTCVALSKSDMYVVSGSKDNSILMWDLNDSSHARRELRPKWSKFNSGNEQRLAGEILAVCISSDDRYIASGGRDSMVRIFDSRQRFAEVHAFSGHRGSVNALTFQSNSSKLFSGSSDGCVKHWSVSDFAYIETLFGHQDAIHAMDCLNKDRPISSSSDRSVRIWKIEDESHLVFRGHKSSIDCVSYLDDSSFVTGGQDGTIHLWKNSQKHAVRSVVAAHGSVESCKGGPSNPRWIVSMSAVSMSNVFASGSNDGFVRIWSASLNSKNLEQVAIIPVRGFVNGLAVSKHLMVAGTGTEHRLGRWSTIRGNCNKIVVKRFKV